MKRILLFFASCLIVTLTFAQRPTATIAQVNAFLKSTLYVVTDENPTSEYNMNIKIAVEKNWKITNFEFINYTDFESKRLDPANSFLVLSEINFPKDKVQMKYDFVSILVGGNFPSVNEMPEICTFPVGYSEGDDDASMYKLPAIIGFFNLHITNMQTNPKLLKDKKYAYYTKQAKNMKKSTFYLVADEQLPELNTDKKIKPLYSGKITLMGRDEIGNFIEKRMNNVVFLHKVGPSDSKITGTRCYTIVMGTDFTLYYFKYHLISEKAPNGLMANDWKTLGGFSN
jgi:hypothetical protein